MYNTSAVIVIDYIIFFNLDFSQTVPLKTPLFSLKLGFSPQIHKVPLVIANNITQDSMYANQLRAKNRLGNVQPKCGSRFDESDAVMCL